MIGADILERLPKLVAALNADSWEASLAWDEIRANAPAIARHAVAQAQQIAALQAALMVPDDDEGMPGSQPQSYKEFSSSCDRLDGKL